MLQRCMHNTKFLSNYIRGQSEDFHKWNRQSSVTFLSCLSFDTVCVNRNRKRIPSRRKKSPPSPPPPSDRPPRRRRTPPALPPPPPPARRRSPSPASSQYDVGRVPSVARRQPSPPSPRSVSPRDLDRGRARDRTPEPPPPQRHVTPPSKLTPPPTDAESHHHHDGWSANQYDEPLPPALATTASTNDLENESKTTSCNRCAVELYVLRNRASCLRTIPQRRRLSTSNKLTSIINLIDVALCLRLFETRGVWASVHGLRNCESFFRGLRLVLTRDALRIIQVYNVCCWSV